MSKPSKARRSFDSFTAIWSIEPVVSPLMTGCLDKTGPLIPGPPRSQTWKRSACILTFLCLGCLLQGAAYSHITSFFNRYALEVKNLSSSQYGIILSAYCLVTVFVTPLTAKIVTLRYFKDKTLLFIGWTIEALFCLLMSTTHKLGIGVPFFLGSLIVRFLEAIGFAVGFPMMYVVTGLELNNINHIMIPLLETVYGMSVVAGPALGGILFDLGGYPLPFLAMGSALLTLMIVAIGLFPKPQTTTADEDASESVTIWAAWRFPVIVNVLCTMTAFAVVSFNESTLALRLNGKFRMSATESGLLFLYAGGTYAASSLLSGYASKKIFDPRYFVLSGQVLTLVALALQGPLIPIKQTRRVVILAQILLGTSVGPSFVCSYMQSLRYLSNGKETKEMYAALSALFTPAASIGCTIGPFMAGIILDHWSYETAVVVNCIQTGLMAILLSLSILFCNKTITVAERQEKIRDF